MAIRFRTNRQAHYVGQAQWRVRMIFNGGTAPNWRNRGPKPRSGHGVLREGGAASLSTPARGSGERCPRSGAEPQSPKCFLAFCLL